MLDPVSQTLLQHLPKGGDYFLSHGNLRNYARETFIRNFEKRMTVRLDHHMTGGNQLTGRYSQVPIRGDRGRGDFQIGRDEVNSGGTDYNWSRQILLTGIHTFSPRLYNEPRLKYTFRRFTRNDAWAAAVPGRPARGTPAGARTLERINAHITGNRGRAPKPFRGISSARPYRRASSR